MENSTAGCLLRARCLVRIRTIGFRVDRGHLDAKGEQFVHLANAHFAAAAADVAEAQIRESMCLAENALQGTLGNFVAEDVMYPL